MSCLHASLLVLTAAVLPAADDPPAAAPARVAVAELALRDRKRDKDLPLRVLYPEEGGPYPVVVFSPGLGGSRDGGEPLAQHWAAHGYVVILLTHDDALALRPRDEKARPADVLRDLRKLRDDPRVWEGRVRDVTLVLDSLEGLPRQVPGLKGKADARRVGVAGHSLGAFTAQLLGGVSIDVPGGARGRSFADARPRAVLLLSSQGAGALGLTERSWDGLERPTMVVTGSKDRGADGQDPAWREEPFRRCPAGDKYLVCVEGASHNLGGVTAGQHAPPRFRNEGQMRAIQKATLSFWDAYLKGRPEARTCLQSDTLAQPGKVRFSRR
jgi:predicted dienelactone hydrolase